MWKINIRILEKILECISSPTPIGRLFRNCYGGNMNFRNFSIETCVHGGWGETIGRTRNWSVRKPELLFPL
jgi:hypothetical protein